MLVVLQQALLSGFGDHRRELIRGVGGAELVHGRDPGEPDAPVGKGVEKDDQGAGQACEPDQRRREPKRSLLRPGESDVLRHHLAEHDVQADDDRQRDRQPDRAVHARGDTERAQASLDQVSD